MILVDTSVWVDHFRAEVRELEMLVGLGQVLSHPFIIGEIAVGDPRDWQRVGSLLQVLPAAQTASEAAFLALIAGEKLGGTGLGFVDVHLLAACRLRPGTRLWSRDKRLVRHAQALNVGWNGDRLRN